MGFTNFTAGNLAKASEVNANYVEMLKISSDIALLNTTTIDVYGVVGSNFKMLDLFSDYNGSNNSVDIPNTTAAWNYQHKAFMAKLSEVDTVTEPSFETVTTWTYSETDSGCSGGQTDTWSTAGTYSYKLNTGSVPAGSYPQILQSVDFTNIDYIQFDYNHDKEYSTQTGNFRCYIDGATLFSIVTDNISTAIIDTTDITGSVNLIFRLIDGIGIASTWIDNILTKTFVDSYILSTARAVGTGSSYAFIRPRLYVPLPSGTSLTCYISLDGGSTFSAESAVNEIISLSGLTDTGSLVVKLNLNTNVAQDATPIVLGWSIQLFR